MRLMMKGDCHQVAKLMMNGCNMGIQSIAKCQNECKDASWEARQIAEGLIHTEEDFMGRMKEILELNQGAYAPLRNLRVTSS